MKGIGIMADVQVDDYVEVLKTVQDWPFSQRIALVQDILRALVPELAILEAVAPRTRRNTLQEALGLLSTDQSPPSDEEIQEWLDEHRLEKYGQR
jgi:hypothetical protein